MSILHLYIYITPECGECGDVIHFTHVDGLSTNGTTADNHCPMTYPNQRTFLVFCGELRAYQFVLLHHFEAA